MRKTSYVITFVAVALTLSLNILAWSRPDWLVVKLPEVLRTKVTISYGLNQECVLTLTEIHSGKGEIVYREYECRKFPAKVDDHCEDKNEYFCNAWTSAGYLEQVAIGFAALSLATILLGISTHSRRRRIWRAVAGLVALQALCQLVAFALITDLYRTSRYQTFDQARPGLAYILNVLSWIVGVFIASAVLITGISADKGHRWAAGNRAYHPIEG